jgi:hypothetical protein
VRSCQVPQGRRTAATAGLEDVSGTDPGNRPSGAIMNNHHGPVRSQVVVDEVCVRLGQPAPLDSEVTHPLGHQDVLQLIVHVVQHDVGIAPQQCWCDRPTELQRLIRAISPTCATGTSTVSGSQGTCIAAAR